MDGRIFIMVWSTSWMLFRKKLQLWWVQLPSDRIWLFYLRKQDLWTDSARKWNWSGTNGSWKQTCSGFLQDVCHCCRHKPSSPEHWREEHVNQKTVVKDGNNGAFSWRCLRSHFEFFPNLFLDQNKNLSAQKWTQVMFSWCGWDNLWLLWICLKSFLEVPGIAPYILVEDFKCVQYLFSQGQGGRLFRVQLTDGWRDG